MAAIFFTGQSRANAGASEKSANQPEERAGREHHVEPGDRHDVIDAGCTQHVVRRLRNEPALARHERRADAAGRPADGGRDALGQRIARRIDLCRQLQRPIRLHGRFENPRLPDHGSHGPDPLVIGVAREIVATRPGGLGRRQQAGGAGNELPCAELCPFTDRDPHEPRPLGLRDILQLNQPQEQPLPVLAILDGFDEAREGRDDDAVENGRGDAAGPDGAGTEPGKDGGKGNRRGQRPYAAAQDEGADAGDRERPNRRPEGRCPVGLEEQEDADPEAHGEPGEQPALLDLPRDGS